MCRKVDDYQNVIGSLINNRTRISPDSQNTRQLDGTHIKQ